MAKSGRGEQFKAGVGNAMPAGAKAPLNTFQAPALYFVNFISEGDGTWVLSTSETLDRDRNRPIGLILGGYMMMT